MGGRVIWIRRNSPQKFLPCLGEIPIVIEISIRQCGVSFRQGIIQLQSF